MESSLAPWAFEPQLVSILMVYTINVEIRDYLRLDATSYPEADLKNKIERALAFLNLKTGETYTIADYDNANTASSPYDELIVFYSLWHIHMEIYKVGISAADAKNSSKHLSTKYRELFFDHLAACYPNLVKMVSGKLMFTDSAAPGTDVGFSDSRFAADEAAQFDRTA